MTPPSGQSKLTLPSKLQGLDNDAAPLDGAKREVFKKLDNIFHLRPKVDIVTKAEEHAEQLHGAAAGFQK